MKKRVISIILVGMAMAFICQQSIPVLSSMEVAAGLIRQPVVSEGPVAPDTETLTAQDLLSEEPKATTEPEDPAQTQVAQDKVAMYDGPAAGLAAGQDVQAHTGAPGRV